MSISSLLRFCPCGMITLAFISLFQVAIADTRTISQPQPPEAYWMQQNLLQLQDRLTRVETNLEQQKSISEDLKNVKIELLDLKISLAKLEAQAGSQQTIQENQFNVVRDQISGRVSDLQSYIGYIFTILTVTLGFGAYFTFRHSERIAENEMSKFIDSNKDSLLNQARSELAKTREDVDKNIASISTQVMKSHKEFSTQIKQLRELANAQIDDMINQFEQKQKELYLVNKNTSDIKLSDQQKRQLDLAIKLKSEEDNSHEDWYRLSISQFSSGDFGAALHSIDNALTDENILSESELARYLLRKAICYTNLDQVTEAISVYDTLITRFINTKDLELQEQVANALINSSAIYIDLKLYKNTIASCDMLFEKLNNSLSYKVQNIIAGAFINKGVALSRLGYYDEAISTSELLLAAYTDSVSPPQPEIIIKALINKAHALGLQQKNQEAIDIYDFLLKNYAPHQIPAMRDNIESAYANVAEQAIFCESTEQVLQRIKACEDVTSSKEAIAVMQFLRFIIGNTPITSIINSIQQIPRTTKLTWQFDELQLYINANVSGNRLRHCQAVIGFFEDHKDLERLAVEVDC